MVGKKEFVGVVIEMHICISFFERMQMKTFFLCKCGYASLQKVSSI